MPRTSSQKYIHFAGISMRFFKSLTQVNPKLCQLEICFYSFWSIVAAVKLLEVWGPGRGPCKYLKWFVQVWFLSWIKNTKKRCKLNSNLLQRGKNDGPKFEPNLSWKERVFCSFLKIDIPLNTESAENYSKEIPYIYLFRITAFGQMKVSCGKFAFCDETTRYCLLLCRI